MPVRVLVAERMNGCDSNLPNATNERCSVWCARDSAHAAEHVVLLASLRRRPSHGILKRRSLKQGAAAVEVTGSGVELGICAALRNCLCKKHAGGKLWCCGGSLLVDGRGIACVVGVYGV